MPARPSTCHRIRPQSLSRTRRRRSREPSEIPKGPSHHLGRFQTSTAHPAIMAGKLRVPGRRDPGSRGLAARPGERASAARQEWARRAITLMPACLCPASACPPDWPGSHPCPSTFHHHWPRWPRWPALPVLQSPPCDLPAQGGEVCARGRVLSSLPPSPPLRPGGSLFVFRHTRGGRRQRARPSVRSTGT